MSSGLPSDFEPPPSTLDDVENSKFHEAWEHARDVKVDCHKTTGTFKLATSPKDRKAVTAKWLLYSQTGKYGMEIRQDWLRKVLVKLQA